jgi:hypothetical protein
MNVVQPLQGCRSYGQDPPVSPAVIAGLLALLVNTLNHSVALLVTTWDGIHSMAAFVFIPTKECVLTANAQSRWKRLT